MERRHGEHGQATSEYVALVALMALVLALAAGLTSGGLGSNVVAALQRGLCQLPGAPCRPPVAPTADLAPCILTSSSRVERLSETIAVVRLGSSGTLTAVRTSDGRVTVTLADGSDVGAELGAGARLHLGRRSLGSVRRLGAEVAWTSGRSWTFADEAAAGRFVAAYGAKATIGGKLVDQIRSRCSLLCDAIGWRPHPELPPPDATFEEGGASATLAAAFGGEPGADADLGAVIGRRIGRDGATTWYLRLDVAASEGLELGIGWPAGSLGGEVLLSASLDARGRPVTLGLKVAGEAGGRAAVSGMRGTAAVAVAAHAGRVVELEATLDLRDPANRAVAGALLDALRDPRRLLTAPARARDLGTRIAHHGQLDRRLYAARDAATGIGVGVAVGLKAAVGFERTTSGLRLLSAETRLPGLPFLPRDDCRPA